MIDENDVEFIPYYEGFKGQITKISDGKFLIKGNYEKIGTDKIKVTEFPVGYWTEDFKELLETLSEETKNKEGKKLIDKLLIILSEHTHFKQTNTSNYGRKSIKMQNISRH